MAAFFAEVADVVNAGVGGGVDFDNVEIGIFEFVGEGVDFVGEDAGDAGFAGTAGAGEEVGVGDFALGEGFGENIGDLGLADDLGEGFGAIFAIEGFH